MAKQTKHFQVRRPDKELLAQVKRIAESPAGESPEVKRQLETLAKAIGEVADHCADLDSLLAWLTKNVTFSR